MLANGVSVDLPKTKAEPLPSSEEQPLMVSVDQAGAIYIGTQEEPVALEELAPMLKAIAGENLDRRVYVRGDQAVAYGSVVKVLSLLQSAGFSKAGMVVDDPTSDGG